MQKRQIALVTGDGSGPEMMKIACWLAQDAAALDDIQLEFVDTPMGWNAFEKFGDTFPQESFKRATEIGSLFFGGVGDPKYDDTIGKEKPELRPEARALLPIRKQWGLLLNFRPMVYFRELAHLSKVKIDPEIIPETGIQQHWVRFLLEDSYFGNEDLQQFVSVGWELAEKLGRPLSLDSHEMVKIKLKREINGSEGMVIDQAYYQQVTVEKYLRFIFNYAKKHGLPVISVDKANVMARYDLWRKISTRIGKEEFPEVPLHHQLVDSCNALLFEPQKLHGVIACGNEHGDILSDGAAAAMGGMGLMCSSAINPDNGMAMFESGAGTAPTLAGQNKANPIGRILTGAMMLRHIGAVKGADVIERGVNLALRDGCRTGDIFGQGDDPAKVLGTSEMGMRIRACMDQVRT